jgi:tRNA threonylcarbamoyladenosine biosynthesis protein TsaB
MPKLLIVDTSSSICGVGLSAAGSWQQLETKTPRQAAQEVLSLIDSLLRGSELKLSQLDAIVITTGPGSFTGLRIGIGIVQGLAEASGIPVIAVSNLALCAYSHLKHTAAEGAIVCLSARDEECYWAAYQRCQQLGVRLQGDEKVIASLDQQTALNALTGVANWGLVGDGWNEDLLATTTSSLSASLNNTQVCLRDLCEIAEKQFAAKLWLKPEHLSPNYVKEELDYLS